MNIILYIVHSTIHRYKNYHSKLKIKYEVSFRSRFDNDHSPCNFVTSDEVEKLLNSKKAAGRDNCQLD